MGIAKGNRYERYAAPPADFEPPYPPPYADRGAPCVPREAVRARLFSEGWGDFRDFEPRGRVVLVQARRPSGRLFDLTIDRCSGEVVDARSAYGLVGQALTPTAATDMGGVRTGSGGDLTRFHRIT